jgi:hypothetical protein
MEREPLITVRLIKAKEGAVPLHENIKAAFAECNKSRAALAAIREQQDSALAEWKEFAATVPKRMSASQRERSAYLRGRLAGLHAAMREFEKREPLQIVGSGAEAAN